MVNFRYLKNILKRVYHPSSVPKYNIGHYYPHETFFRFFIFYKATNFFSEFTTVSEFNNFRIQMPIIELSCLVWKDIQ